jgi:hypothetical protein
MIYLKKINGTIEQHPDELRPLIEVDIRVQGESFGTLYTADSLPDEDKLKLKLITKKQIEERDRLKVNSEIISELNQIDMLSIRPLRAKLAGEATKSDDEKLLKLEQDAVLLRDKIK